MNKYVKSLKEELTKKGVEESLIDEAIKELPQDDFVNLTPDELSKMMDEVAQKTLEKAGINEISNKLEALQDEKVSETSKRGFKGLYDFAKAVKNVHSAKDERLFKEVNGKALTTTDPGEFIIPEEYSTQIMATVLDDPGFFGRMTNFSITGNSFKIPYWVDKNHTDGNLFGGMQVYYEDEGKAVDESKLKFGKMQLDLHKLMGYITTSNEMLEDSPTALDVLLRDKFGEVINYKLNDVSINGTGAGQILGVLNSDALIQVAIEPGQTLTTNPIVAKNFYKMWARMYNPSKMRAIWLLNNTVVPEVMSLTQANSNLWLTNNNIAGAPYGTILGRPVLVTEFSKVLGSVGDVIFIDWSQYVSITKQGATPNFASSMHLKFDLDKTAFKVTFRHDAQPAWETYITPKEAGDFTMSAFVTLAERT